MTQVPVFMCAPERMHRHTPHSHTTRRVTAPNPATRTLLAASVDGDITMVLAVLEARNANGVTAPCAAPSDHRVSSTFKHEALNAAVRTACTFGHEVALRHLMQQPHVDLASDGNFCLISASAHGHLAIVDRLLRSGRVDASAQRNAALRWACTFGHVDVVRRLLAEPRVDAGDDDHVAIRRACRNGKLAVAQCLLATPGVDATARDHEALRQACAHGHTAIVRCLLRVDGVDPAAKNCEALIAACTHGHADVVEALFATGRADRNVRQLALLHAVGYKHAPVVERLLRCPDLDTSVNAQYCLFVTSVCPTSYAAPVMSALLKDKRLNPAVGSHVALRSAAKQGVVDAVHQFLQDERVRNDEAAIHCALDAAYDALRDRLLPSACRRRLVDVIRVLHHHGSARRMKYSRRWRDDEVPLCTTEVSE